MTENTESVRGRVRRAMARLGIPKGTDDPTLLALGAAPLDPHYPEHAWVWVDGNYIDAVVIYREWAAYQRAAMAKADAAERAHVDGPGSES